MAMNTERPVVLPLSNPTANSEAVPSDLIKWTHGRAILATGSPFDPVTYGGLTSPIGQANNVYIFPGVGLAALVAEAREVTNEMFAVAANTLAEQVTESDLSTGLLFPPLGRLRQVTAKIAEAVVRKARDLGLGRPWRDEEVPGVVASAMWKPHYPRIVAKESD